MVCIVVISVRVSFVLPLSHHPISALMAKINMDGLLHLDGQGNGTFTFSMAQPLVEVFVHCPTPDEVWDRCVADDWPVHDSKALSDDQEISGQRYNIQGRLKLKLGPKGTWTEKAWLEMRKWFGKPRRIMAMITLPAPPLALAIAPPPPPVAVPVPVQSPVPSPVAAVDEEEDEDEDEDEDNDDSDTEDSDTDQEEVDRLKARVLAVEEEIASTEQSRQEEEADHEETRGLLQKSEDRVLDLEDEIASTEQSRQEEEADHEETRGLLRHAEDMLKLEQSETKRFRTMLDLLG
jgi:hypothetical protein